MQLLRCLLANFLPLTFLNFTHLYFFLFNSQLMAVHQFFFFSKITIRTIFFTPALSTNPPVYPLPLLFTCFPSPRFLSSCFWLKVVVMVEGEAWITDWFKSLTILYPTITPSQLSPPSSHLLPSPHFLSAVGGGGGGGGVGKTSEGWFKMEEGCSWKLVSWGGGGRKN